ncbi:MAG: cytochrome c [Thiotrichaceae bacterium]
MQITRWSLMVLLLLTGFVACATEEKSEDKADVSSSKLHEANCISCHATMFDGKATEIYTRKDRKVKNLEGLKARVQMCATNLNLQWFDEDVDEVANYLNSEFYHFKPEAKQPQ